jgi:ferredoxin like protein
MKNNRLSIDLKLSTVLIKFEHDPHITLEHGICRTCAEMTCLYVYPAENYQIDDSLKNNVMFNHESCLECGSCRFIFSKGAIKWSYPKTGHGVKFLY